MQTSSFQYRLPMQFMNMLNITGLCEAHISPLYYENWLHALLPIHLTLFNHDNFPSFPAETLLCQDSFVRDHYHIIFEKS